MIKFSLKLISSLLFSFYFILGVSSSSFSQSLDPLETQPSDFGEMEKNIENKMNQAHTEEKHPLSEMEAFIAQAKKLVIEKTEIRSAERQ